MSTTQHCTFCVKLSDTVNQYEYTSCIYVHIELDDHKWWMMGGLVCSVWTPLPLLAVRNSSSQQTGYKHSLAFIATWVNRSVFPLLHCADVQYSPWFSHYKGAGHLYLGSKVGGNSTNENFHSFRSWWSAIKTRPQLLTAEQATRVFVSPSVFKPLSLRLKPAKITVNK